MENKLVSDFLLKDIDSNIMYCYRYTTLKNVQKKVMDKFLNAVLKIWDEKKVNHKTEVNKELTGVFIIRNAEGIITNNVITLKVVAKRKYMSDNTNVEESLDWKKLVKKYDKQFKNKS